MGESVKQKRKRGDRWDGKLLRDLDPMHLTMPFLYPNRCDNEAFISDIVDLSKTSEYLDAFNKNRSSSLRCSPFFIMVAAMLKTVMQRDRMNRFIVNGYTYQRNEVSASFVVKKNLRDNGEEGLAIIKATDKDTLSSICKKICEKIAEIRYSNTPDPSMKEMEKYTKMPLFLYKKFVGFTRFLDRHGKVPKSFVKSDPYYSSIILTYLGSVRMQSGYHHLTNWGTNSVFLSVGEKKLRPFYDRNGDMAMKDSIDIAFTIDERIADGYYYAKTVRLFKKLVENPELLEKPFGEEIKI